MFIATFALMLLNHYPKVEAETGTIVDYDRINDDRTWGIEGSPYHLRDEVWIEHNGNLKIDPGVEIIGEGGGFVLKGNLNLIGTPEKPISLTNLFFARSVPSLGELTIDNALLNNVNSSFSSNKFTLTNSILSQSIITTSQNETKIEKNVFKNDSKLRLQNNFQLSIQNNTFVNNLKSPALDIIGVDDIPSKYLFKGNNFMDVGKEVISILNHPSSFQTATIPINFGDNYFGTNDPSVINQRIKDGNDDPNNLVIADYLPIKENFSPDAPFIFYSKNLTDQSEMVSGNVVGDQNTRYSVTVKTVDGSYIGQTTENGILILQFLSKKQEQLSR